MASGCIDVLLNDAIPVSDWREFLKQDTNATPFQTPEFYYAHNEVIGKSATVLALAESGRLISLVVVTFHNEFGLKAFFSRRGIIYGGPLISNNDTKSLDLLLQQLNIIIKSKTIYSEIRNFSDCNNFKPFFEKRGWEYVPHHNIRIDLSSHDKYSLLNKFQYNRRREIRLSLENGASYLLCNNDDQVREVYKVLKQNYHDRVKLPLPGVDFFLRYFHTDALKIFAVVHNNEIIGGSFCPVIENRCLFTFYYCGFRDYHKKIFPTHLAILAAMEYCIDKKIPHFDFMGAGKPGVEYGVRKYKMEFGGELVEYGRFMKINKHLLYKIGELGIKLRNYSVR